MSLRYLLALMLAFLRPAVGDPEDPPVDPKDPPADPDPEDLEDPDEDPDPDPEDPAVKAAADLEAARKESRENKEKAERFEREAADLRLRHAPRHDDINAQEDAKLKDPATPALEKWQIEANRTLRSSTSTAQMALAQAHDVSDRTAFAAVAISNPLAKKYEPRVEEALVKARQNGQYPRREDIFKYMLGQDMLDGKFKKKAAAAGKPEGDKGVNRGKLPGARSDVNAKGATTEREKRRARLQDVQI